MSFLVSDVISQCRSALDEEDIAGQTYYSDTLDFIPACNYAQQWIIWLVNEKLGMNKFGEEALREITTTNIFQTNNYSRVQIPETIWNITTVWAKPTTIPTNPTITPHADPSTSFLRTDVSLLGVGGGAKRLTSQEWSGKNGNPFMQGYSKETGRSSTLTSYAYKEVTNYQSSVYTEGKEIEISPLVPNTLVGIEYILVPVTVTQTTDTLPFPDSIFNIFFNAVLKFIAYKQGDQTTIYLTVMQDLQHLLTGIGVE